MADKDVQESWYEVEDSEGIQTVRSTEEMTELLADAAAEKIIIETDEIERLEDIMDSSVHVPVPQTESLVIAASDEECDETPLTFNISQEHPFPQQQWEYHHTTAREKTGYLNGLIFYFKDFLKSLLNPAVVASHMAVFGLGIFIGRRLVS